MGYLDNLTYEECPAYKKGDLYLIDRRLSLITCYRELPKSTRDTHLAQVRSYYFPVAYGTGVQISAFVLDDMMFKNKIRLIHCILAKSNGECHTVYIPVSEFRYAITKRRPKPAKKTTPVDNSQ
jgi:hypothetical protein